MKKLTGRDIYQAGILVTMVSILTYVIMGYLYLYLSIDTNYQTLESVYTISKILILVGVCVVLIGILIHRKESSIALNEESALSKLIQIGNDPDMLLFERLSYVTLVQSCLFYIIFIYTSPFPYYPLIRFNLWFCLSIFFLVVSIVLMVTSLVKYTKAKSKLMQSMQTEEN